MQISLSLARRAVFGAAAVAAVLMTGACGDGSGGDDNLIYVTLKVDSITQEGKCDIVSVRATPKNLLPDPPKLSNSRMFYTEVEMSTPADAGVQPICRGEKQTIPMASGAWELKALLPSGPVACEREVKIGDQLTVSFKDGEASCT